MNLSSVPFQEHPLVAKALALLDDELPDDLAYHNKEHTVSVITKVVKLAKYACLSDRDTELLVIAAAWHDTGYRERRLNNEPLAAKWVGEVMRGNGGYSKEEIDKVKQAILDTQMKPRPEDGIPHQVSKGSLSPWLLDADLANFGSPNFFALTFRLMQELGIATISTVDDLSQPGVLEFLLSSSKLLGAHDWKTEGTARELFQEQKEVNQGNLDELINAITNLDGSALERVWQKILPYPNEPQRLCED